MITSGVIEAREEARSAALGQDYQVLKALSAGSLKPPSAQERPALFPEACQVLLPACLGAGRSQGMIQPDGRLCLAQVTTWLITPEQHRNQPDCRRGFLARLVVTWRSVKKNLRAATHGAPCTVPISRALSTRLTMLRC